MIKLDKSSLRWGILWGAFGVFLSLFTANAFAQSVPQDSVRTQPSPLRLLMIEQIGCAVCAQFNREIAPIYQVSPEGNAAPLIHVDLRGPLPDNVTLNSRPFVTPTFILVDETGRELSRLTGFPGEDFFWPFLNEMIDAAQMQ